ncbi:S8 family serine peptidase [Streptomyces sp. NPDC051554]|uniref:S53 family peptidase n=1 Tax=Streptomyces sp. NPDC051554 TaxID=3365656 RepID=UPI00378FCFB4
MTTSYRALTAGACAAALALTAVGCADGNGSTGSGTRQPARALTSASPSTTVRPFPQVPSIAECRRTLGFACYTPDLVRTAYGIDKLNASGLTGKGRTVVVYEEVVPDTLKKDLETFSKAMKLPAPDLTVDSYDPAGRIARFDAKNKDMAATAVETTLDVQMVHMTAPDAKIVVTQIGLPASAYRSALSSGTSPSGTPEPEPEQEAGRRAAEGAAAGAELILDGIAQSVREHRPDAISVSFGIDEYTAAGGTTQPAADLAEFSAPLAQVVAAGTTLVASAGDSGAAPPIGPDGRRVRSVSWPASDPSVLSLGASRLHLDEQGKRTAPDTVWHDKAGATGGGPSQTFSRPAYQNSVTKAVGDDRGTSDISLDGSASGGTLIYQSFLPAGTGWMPVGGTSEAAPMFAALVALANEKAHARLGTIHEELYELAAKKDGGVVDITEGDNDPDGYQATKGYDLASGLGTVDASVFVPALTELAATHSP